MMFMSIPQATATIELSAYSNDLSTDKRERGLGEHRNPAEELALGAANAVELDKRTRVLPVAETETVVVRSTTKVEDDTKDDETNDRDNFDRAADATLRKDQSERYGS